MGEVLTPDICVVGAGVGGVTAALAAALYGVPVVLVEKGELGGAHLHGGGVASKALGAIARRAAAFGQAKAFGLNAPRPKVDFYGVHDRVRAVIDAASANLSTERLNGLGVRVVKGAGRFKDRNTLGVEPDIEIRARRFIIATGSLPALPPIPGLEAVPYLTAETIFDLLVCPKHLVVIGATATGLELAQAYRWLGAEVTVLDGGEPLAGHDPECAAIVLEQLEREGVRLRARVPIARIKSARTKIQIFLAGDSEEEKIEATHLLLAAGRKPNVMELDLAAADIGHEDGRIVADRHSKTSNKRIYAIGGAVGASPGGHVARKQAELVVRHALLRMSFKLNDSRLARIVFTQPELAQAGMSEAEVRETGRVFRVLRWPFRENDRARAESETTGHVKIIAAKDGKILGAAIVGPQAGELIAPWALALHKGMNIAAMAELAMPPLTYADVGRQAAVSYFLPGLARPWIRRIIDIVRLLG
jgi:pyruvate/2-oxoglutarate dehydrogenase complex dihydrolipoamide dehydrogenase (E3) component